MRKFLSSTSVDLLLTKSMGLKPKKMHFRQQKLPRALKSSFECERNFSEGYMMLMDNSEHYSTSVD